MRRKVVWVKWRDASFSGSRWLDFNEKYPLKVLETVGFFIRQDREVLEIGDDYDPQYGRWRGVTSIPVECIVKKKVVNIDA